MKNIEFYKKEIYLYLFIYLFWDKIALSFSVKPISINFRQRVSPNRILIFSCHALIKAI